MDDFFVGNIINDFICWSVRTPCVLLLEKLDTFPTSEFSEEYKFSLCEKIYAM